MPLELNENQRMIKQTFRKFMEKEVEPHVEKMEAGEETAFPFIKKMIDELDLMSMYATTASAEVDEDRLQLFLWPTLIVEMARVSPSFAFGFGVSIGLFAGNIMRRGTPEQIEHYGMPALKGDLIGAWALTEPGAGSDALGGMKTRAVKDGDHYVLNGSKTFITNAPCAEAFLVYAKYKLDDGRDSVQAFIVDRGCPGLTTGQPFKKMGVRGSPTGEVFMDDCRVPLANILGGGVKERDHVKKSLAGERSGIPAICLGIIDRCFEVAVKYAKERQQFGQPIANYQLMQARLARMYTALMNVENIVFKEFLAGRRLNQPVADICAGKLYCGEMATFVANEAVMILGGYGYMEEYVVERMARDAKIMEIGAGTTEMQILTLARDVLERD
ncbi:MAG: acyl-CoA dehydrogenase [Candidatus Abyssobacteria bacterium SURF_17]|jgi:alkylation response protein AidB-like acyl-CoA dehydrogenase|uniref:Acyl-CoA dehydrogenase n=1 Tax=Candidatus Abyssobacteria bacterium SURF_17 TaxID=2093361 RepID=A0A419F8P7_9BACT|nr:MAG: acyl-CoA dehydrogenase [Candidatus Abyssubacteria bacterium SURF_17]